MSIAIFWSGLHTIEECPSFRALPATNCTRSERAAAVAARHYPRQPVRFDTMPNLDMQALEKLKPLSLLILRVTLGMIFCSSGYRKLFVASAGTLADFRHMGLPGYMGYVAGVLELFGGILLILGLLTRVTALLLAIEMGFVLVKVQIPEAGLYRWTNYEYPLTLFAATFALATVGAGLLSVDAATFESGGKSRSKSKAKN
jgi:putative oxidoreductase